MEHFDVLIVGAGLSGIGAGCHLQTQCPGKTYAILEARSGLGGTWDLFRYPGIRSDSDMYTLGYSFRPWKDSKAIADGPAILDYLRKTAAESGVEKKIRFGHRILAAEWSTEAARWTVAAERDSDKATLYFTCDFLFMCAGYYNYAQGYSPDFPGIGSFAGRVVHPQEWTEDIDYSGKRVVVIGSGATAVTLVPELAKKAAHVTMLQRSPTYVVARPAEDALANWLRRHLPLKLAYALTRWKNVLLGMYFFRLCRKRPERAKALLLNGVRQALGDEFDIGTHFTPRYNPWEQRLCLVPDGDLFDSIRDRRAEVVTDRIATFTPQGIRLESGRLLEADLVVTATGLDLQFLGGMAMTIDGQPVESGNLLTYKGMMFNGVPNLVSFFGYTNASWTLKSDLTAEYACRLLNHMTRRGWRQCTPRLKDTTIGEVPFVDFSSGYFARAAHKLPKQGSRTPWRLHQNYALDILGLRYGTLEDGMMEFSNPTRRSAA